MRLSDRLRRFRPVGTPGAAAPAGVPADEDAEQLAELAPVFEALRDTVREAEQLRAAAEDAAAAIEAAADEKVVATEADARRQMAEARAEVSAERAQVADEERRRLLSEADDAAALVDRTAAARLPTMIDRVVGSVLDPSASTPAGSPGPAS